MEAYKVTQSYQTETATPGSSNFIKKIASGPLLTDDGRHMIGSLLIVESTRAEAESFAYNDPFHAIGVWSSVNISRYISPGGIAAVPRP